LCVLARKFNRVARTFPVFLAFHIKIPETKMSVTKKEAVATFAPQDRSQQEQNQDHFQ
jgi:hypothetical protein